jgi:hypothetical protein
MRFHSHGAAPWGLHLIYRIKGKRLEAYGLFETHGEAEKDLALINRDGSWRIAEVPCLGWGILDRVVNRRNPPPSPKVYISPKAPKWLREFIEETFPDGPGEAKA